MDKLLKKLNVDETYTKAIKKPTFDKVKQNTFPKADYNYMADLLFLPETKAGFKYLLVVVDLWSNEFDIEPLKTKESNEVLKAMQIIFKRKYLSKPEASIRTDSGTEFQGVFHKWLYDNSILHRVAEPYRHQQMGNVEAMNNVLGRLFNGYMNAKENETGKIYKEWTDVIEIIRKDLNKLRLLKDGDPYKIPMTPPTDNKPIFKIGDIVIRKLERPQNALGHAQNTVAFRQGDYRFDIKNPRKITQILYYPKNIRYILNEHPNVSYTSNELKAVKEAQEKYVVKAIIDKKTEKKIIYYKVWWQGYLKKDATWEPIKDLIKDGLHQMITDYENSL